MNLLPKYDVAIAGGGLAGLACAIQLSNAGFNVIVFEKEAYPFHKVCGEYISMESWPFLESLGLPLNKFRLPIIDTLQLTAPDGSAFTTDLPLGGFGISRYLLDSELAALARKAGVHVVEETKVESIKRDKDFVLQINSKQYGNQSIKATVCCAAYGKRSNLDVKENRAFLQQQDKRLENYVGIKYHIQSQWKENVIGLHNFKNGYCGISKIEEDKYCLCYMTHAGNLKAYKNDIAKLQSSLLAQNPHLKNLIEQSTVLESFPVTISQISFVTKTQVENGVLMLGDAAGMITPLCGNGMSIALHTAKIAAHLIPLFLGGKITRHQLETQYTQQWQKNFAERLQRGRLLQRFFGSTRLSNVFVRLFKIFPFLAKPVIKSTHGKPF